jgi:hypothetical protein
MTSRSLSRILSVFVLLIPLTLACNLLSQASPAQAPSGNPPQSSTTTRPGEAGTISQWASEAVASSEYGNPGWAANQATGEPNTPQCGDVDTAWAAANQDSVEWINLYFSQPVYPVEIRIVETYYPDQVSQVDLIDMQGKYIKTYSSQPKAVDNPCPYTLTIPVSQGDVLVQGVRLTIDQTIIKNWNEIDAVGISGTPGEGTPVRPSIPAP